MLRSGLIGLVTLGLVACAAFAQSKMDCGNAYKGVWRKFESQKYTKISGAQLAGMSRLALRAYDACQAGDEQDARVLFARIEEWTREWGREGSTGPFNPNPPR